MLDVRVDISCYSPLFVDQLNPSEDSQVLKTLIQNVRAHSSTLIGSASTARNVGALVQLAVDETGRQVNTMLESTCSTVDMVASAMSLDSKPFCTRC